MSIRAAGSCFRAAGAACDDARLTALEAIVGSSVGAGGAVVAKPLILTRATQAVTRDGSNNAEVTITPSLGSHIRLSWSGGALVYGSGGITPFISTAGAVDGQILILVNSTALALQMNAGVAGSKCRFTGNSNKSIGAEDSIGFIYSADDDTWDQLIDVMTIT